MRPALSVSPGAARVGAALRLVSVSVQGFPRGERRQSGGERARPATDVEHRLGAKRIGDSCTGVEIATAGSASAATSGVPGVVILRPRRCGRQKGEADIAKSIDASDAALRTGVVQRSSTTG